ncbi:magnesium-translocating P-type ATPase [Candidatus Woesearchaeota archaeon]|nr:magnesium-translocating P-type ATPase [Candidatus Woesearchaeota archaeon]
MLEKEGEAWSIALKELFSQLKSSDTGLTTSEAEKRLKEQGLNDLSRKEEHDAWDILFYQFKNPLVLVLLAATIISYFLGEKVEAIVILSIVALNILLGFVQEFRAEKASRELKKYVSLKVKVFREGELKEIDSKHLVPGDVVYLNIGDLVPADIRLFYVDNFTTDESPLTGESIPVLKKITSVPPHHDLPSQLFNMAFMGTFVSSGSGKGIVTHTGEKTFFGRTAAYLKKKEPEANFQKSIHKFSNFLLKVILAMTVFIFISNALLGKGYFSSFMFALALAVGITPEILPLIMTVTLSNGALKMAKEKVITKRLASIEDLGNIDTLCCDKTGTLTEGRLTLEKYLNLNQEKEPRLVLYGMLCNSSQGLNKKALDNPIDKSIWAHTLAKSLLPKLKEYTFIDENEFDFERRRMSVIVKKDDMQLLLVKGAPDAVLKVCDFAQLNDHKCKLSSALKFEVERRVKSYESNGYRVIAVAEKPYSKHKSTKYDETGLTLLGFLLFLDPPKKSAREALSLLAKLGVKVKVISGDSPVVTKHICHEVGLVIAERIVITGEELELLSPAQLEQYAQRYNVFARVTPEQKYKLVASLNREGHIVGFLGDGINDAPALRAADVGISVDTASGIAKDAADIILLNKSLHVLIDGIKQGRKVFGNITKYVLNTISANYGNMFTVALSSLFMKFIPLLPVQILLNNFISDVPNLAISTDKVDEELLHKPRKWNIKLISRFMVYFGLLSTFFDLLLIFAMLYVFKVNLEVFRTSWFVESVISEIIILFALRTHLSFFRSKPSVWLVLVSIGAVVFSLALPFWAFSQQLFEFVPLDWKMLVLIGAILGAYFTTIELAKKRFFRKFSE